MEFEDSRFALFIEPNAYIQKFDKKERSEPKKIVFQEPYEILPNYHMNNNFKKHNCDCVKEDKGQKCFNGKGNDFNYDYNDFNKKDENKCSNNNPKQKNNGFDIKNLLPLLGLFNKGGNTDLSQLVGLLGNNGNNQNLDNPMGLISNLLSNKDMMSGVLNLFKGGGLNLFNKNKPIKKELKTTDFEIKNYTRVE